MTYKVKYLYIGEFKSKLETALAHESGDHVGTFGEITLDNKILRFWVSLKSNVDPDLIWSDYLILS